MNRRCDKCEWWVGVEGFGDCRKLPPRILTDVTSVFPITEDSDWCGEFKEKEQEENETT